MNSAHQTWAIANACKKIAGGPNLPKLEPGPLDEHPNEEPKLMWTARIKTHAAEGCCVEDALSNLLTLLMNAG